ncbi:hypothetical protein N7478_000803 [Penicillium angulare]|uniref:uncharacterized protein n=1 Tax=Penicillium angulare TaxID=116970 RepID=UPI00253FCF51|nr:uncharacterized protein N7478_000803 [Penicillium angulare]KAJ5291552.1 hypothetical protein N7478_000803 [Penicillium angulare]
MVLLVSPKVRGRGLFSILRSCLSRRRHFHDSQPSSAEQTQQETKTNLKAMAIAIPEKHTAPNRDTPCTNLNDTDSIVNQLAVLAATIRAPRDDTRSSSSSPSTKTTKSEARLEKEQEIGESFLYLRSLITVSQTPEPKPKPKSKPEPEPEAASKTDSKSDSHPPLRRKRASSRLSLRLEIPPLQFTPKIPKPKPSPRYTTVPPIYAPKSISIRPEVRF